jgi:type II secretory pathway pseudopilin PulG
MRRAHTHPLAFTLVELLVVIGIIAVLISVLLPALGKARQSANLVDCQARLSQMGQAMSIYTTINKGLLPWGVIDRPAGWTADKEMTWWWFMTLGEIMNKNILSPDGYAKNLSPVFRDRDTVPPPDNNTMTDQNGGQRSLFWVNHYTCNPRVLYDSHDPDNAPALFLPPPNNVAILPADRTQRKVTSVRQPSNVFVIWDGPQVWDQGYNTYGSAASMDGWAMDASTAYCFGAPGVSGASYDRPSPPGWLGRGSNGKVLQKKYNIDLRQAFTLPDGWLTHMRFRHMTNTTLAALCLDGHTETRKVGEFKVKDYCTNYR